MKRKVAKKPFSFVVMRDQITVSRDDNEATVLTFSPAEGQQIKDLLTSLQAMEQLTTIPSPIRNGNFKIDIKGKDMRLLREGDPRGSGPKVEWEELDNAIVAVTEAVNVSIDMKKLRKLPRESYTYFSTEGTITEE